MPASTTDTIKKHMKSPYAIVGLVVFFVVVPLLIWLLVANAANKVTSPVVAAPSVPTPMSKPAMKMPAASTAAAAAAAASAAARARLASSTATSRGLASAPAAAPASSPSAPKSASASAASSVRKATVGTPVSAGKIAVTRAIAGEHSAASPTAAAAAPFRVAPAALAAAAAPADEVDTDAPFASPSAGRASRRAPSSSAGASRRSGLTRLSAGSSAAASAEADAAAAAPLVQQSPSAALTLESVFGAKGRTTAQPEDSHGVLARAHSLEKLKEAARRPKDIDVDRATFKKRGEEGAEINAMVSAFLPRLRAAIKEDRSVTPEAFLEQYGLAHETPILEALKLALEMGAPPVGAPKPQPVFRRVADRDGADVDSDPASLKRAASLEIPSRDAGVALAIMTNVLKARAAAKAAGVSVSLTASQKAAAQTWAKSSDSGAAQAAKALLA